MLTRCFERQYAGLPEWRRKDLEYHYRINGNPTHVIDPMPPGLSEDYTPLWWITPLAVDGAKVYVPATWTASQTILMSVKEHVFAAEA